MASEYTTLTFHQTQSSEGYAQIWVLDGSSPHYRIEAHVDIITIRREGALDTQAPVAFFEIGSQLTVTFENGAPFPTPLLLHTQSRTHKILFNGNGKYKWIRRGDEQQAWYEIVNPLHPHLPFVRLMTCPDNTNGVALVLEVTADISLHSPMCDGLIAAIVLMCKTEDAWLEGAGIIMP